MEIHQNTERELLIAAIWQHVGIGMLVFIPAYFFLFLHWVSGEHGAEESSPNRWLTVGRQVMGCLLFLLLLSGPLTVFARGSTLKVFDWFAIPSPVNRWPKTYETLEITHSILAYGFIIVTIVWCVFWGYSLFTRKK